MTKMLMSVALLAGLLAMVGCEKSPPTSPGTQKKNKIESKQTDKSEAKAKSDEDPDKDGWWCKEHGVPEDDCSMCSSKVAKAAKAKGDWCDKHNRAKSICFICDPSLKEKFAAKYVAKFGKEPPEPDDEATKEPAKK